GNCLMRMPSDKHRRLRKFGSQSHYSIGKIIAAGPHLQSHVPAQNDRVCTLSLCSCDCAADRFDRILKFNATCEFWSQPKRDSRSGNANDCELDPCDVLQNERLNLREWMLRIRKCASRLTIQDCVCS